MSDGPFLVPLVVKRTRKIFNNFNNFNVFFMSFVNVEGFVQVTIALIIFFICFEKIKSFLELGSHFTFSSMFNM